MRAYELPTSLNINGVAYTIRTDFRAIIDILIAMNDPDLDQQRELLRISLMMHLQDISRIALEMSDLPLKSIAGRCLMKSLKKQN